MRALADPLLDTRLISRRPLMRCVKAAELVPVSAALGMYGIETRLNKNEQCDLLICALQARHGRQWLSEFANSYQHSNRPGASPVCAFARQWAEEDGYLARQTDRIWLEFDCRVTSRPGLVGENDVSGIFFASNVGNSAESNESYETIKYALTLLLRKPIHRKSAALALDTLRSRLAEECRIFQVGAMVGRSYPDWMRICVIAPNLAACLDTLEGLPSTSIRLHARDILEKMWPITKYIALDLDIVEGNILPHIGIELYADTLGEAPDIARWRPMLNAIEGSGLAIKDKRDALETYPRTHDSTLLPDELWPSLSRSYGILSRHYAGQFVANLHHLKVVLCERESPIAKAYLAIWHEWI
jgi:hypothetical protein